jgi:predicted permease
MVSLHARAAWRACCARPSLTIVRIATVALVTSAATAVLMVVNATLLRPLPFDRPERLVRIFTQPPGTTEFALANPLHPLEFVRFRAQPGSLEAIEGVWAQDRSVAGDGDPESVKAASVSAGLFALLGAQPILGRTFTEDEARIGARVVVLSHGLWTRRYGGEAHVIGRSLLIDRESYAIVGVMGPAFEPVFVASEFWTPLPIREGNLLIPGSTFIQTIGRLAPGVAVERVRAELATRLEALTTESPATLTGWQVKVIDLRQAQYGRQTPALMLLLAAVAALALIAAANLANLTLADVLHRRTEVVVRLALGAGRRDLVWPEVLQAFSLAIAGAVAGVLMGAWLLPAVIALDPAIQLPPAALRIEWRVLAGAFGLSLVVMLIAGVVPTIRVMNGSAGDIASGLAEGARRTAGGVRPERIRTVLVAAQTALALVMLGSGALIASGLQQTARLDAGFDRTHVLTAQLRLAESAYKTQESRTQLVRGVLARIRAIPGIADAATTQNLFVPGFAFVTLVTIEGKPTADGQPHTVQFRRISDGYFRTLSIPVLRGRPIDNRDHGAAMPVAVVSERFAERFWPGDDAIGRRVRRGAATTPWLTVVGVVGDVRDIGYNQVQQETIYVAYEQNSIAAAPVSLVVRTQSDPLGFIAAVKSAVWQVDSAQPLSTAATLEGFLDDSLGPQRFRGVLLGILAILGLTLAAIGTYGVTARTVAERTREAGVRMALGGRPGRVWWGLASRGLRALVAGSAIGAVAVSAAAPVLSSVFPEVSSVSPFVTVPAALVLLITGALATMGAARKITRLDPVVALRNS